MAKAKQAPKPKKPRVKQGFLPGMAPPSVPEIERAADDYVEARDARMAAMDNATRNCEDLVQSLTLKYNKVRQSAITAELMDIVGGTEALAKG